MPRLTQTPVTKLFIPPHKSRPEHARPTKGCDHVCPSPPATLLLLACSGLGGRLVCCTAIALREKTNCGQNSRHMELVYTGANIVVVNDRSLPSMLFVQSPAAHIHPYAVLQPVLIPTPCTVKGCLTVAYTKQSSKPPKVCKKPDTAGCCVYYYHHLAQLYLHVFESLTTLRIAMLLVKPHMMMPYAINRPFKTTIGRQPMRLNRFLQGRQGRWEIRLMPSLWQQQCCC